MVGHDSIKNRFQIAIAYSRFLPLVVAVYYSSAGDAVYQLSGRGRLPYRVSANVLFPGTWSEGWAEEDKGERLERDEW